MYKKRIALFGKNTVAVKILEILLKKDVDLVLVSPNTSDNGIDNWQKSLKKRATELELNVIQFPKIKSVETIEYLRSLKLDFIFSVQYDQIINQSVIDTAKFGAINLHFAPLPRYRGISPIAFALINGEEEFGVTLHYMDPGVDTGDIISQSLFDIKDIKNARELYELSVIKGVELFEDTIDSILNFTNKRMPQDNTKALYFPRGSINFKENKVNFNRDTRTLFNWIRAFIFPPFQYPVFDYEGKIYEIIAAAPDYTKNNFEKPGTLVFKENNFYKFATHDSYINLIVKSD
jgi:methionyl-tRNA formyltransferase